MRDRVGVAAPGIDGDPNAGSAETVVGRKSMDVLSTHRLAEELRAWCRDGGVSQSSLAMQAGVSVSHLNQIINGRARPSRELMDRILDVLARCRARKHRAAAAGPAHSPATPDQNR